MKTALVAIGRRENQYAREWVSHHLALGFDHIYIYDNNHDGEEHFETVLTDFITPPSSIAGDAIASPSSIASDAIASPPSIASNAITAPPVTIIGYRNIEKAQRSAYNDAYQRLSPHYDWIAFFDFDEFLCFAAVPKASALGLKPLGLKPFLAAIPVAYQAVMIPWLMMTDSRLVHNDRRPLMERFTESTTRGGGQGKCIVRGGISGLRFTNSVHVPYEPTLRCCTPKGEPTIQKRHQPQDTEVAYLKHFSTKTIEEWLSNKMQKGAAGITYDTFREKYKDYFFTINERTSEKEAFIRNFGITI